MALLALGVALLPAAVAPTAPQAPPPWSLLPEAVAADSMLSMLAELGDIAVAGGFGEGRPSRSIRVRGHNMTADYIQELLEGRTDFSVEQQWFLAKGDRLGEEEHWVSNVLVRTNRCDPTRRVLVGAHFYNPAHLMPLVEIVNGPQTPDEKVGEAIALMESIGKITVRCKDVPGFVGNRTLRLR